MKIQPLLIVLSIMLPIGVCQAESNAVSQLLRTYAAGGAGTGDAQQGQLMWQKTFKGADEFAQRSCSSCHGTDLTASGRHVKTHKTIRPMAPSVNPERLTNGKKIEKWFKRNCKWTLGRECSVQEKADFLAYISK